MRLIESFVTKEPECFGNFTKIKKLASDGCFTCPCKENCKDEEIREKRLDYLSGLVRRKY
jgi:hypothetical protein